MSPLTTPPLLPPAIEDLVDAQGATQSGVTPPKRPPGKGRSALTQRLLRNKKALVGLLILLAFAAIALAAPSLSPGDPTVFGDATSQPPSAHHLFGTTRSGQDVLAMTLWGSRNSLLIGVSVGVLATVLGGIVGLASGFFGRWLDDLLSLFTNVFLLIPGLPLLIILAAFLPPSSGTIILVLTITGWAGAARVIRSQAMALRGRDYIEAAIVTGETRARIMFREMLANMASVAMNSLLACIVYGIGAQAALEFLGLGNVASVSWGTNLYWAQNDGAILTGAWWTFLPSGLCIALVAFALVLMNFGVDELSNPRLRGRPARSRRRIASDAHA